MLKTNSRLTYMRLELMRIKIYVAVVVVYVVSSLWIIAILLYTTQFLLTLNK